MAGNIDSLAALDRRQGEEGLGGEEKQKLMGNNTSMYLVVSNDTLCDLAGSLHYIVYTGRQFLVLLEIHRQVYRVRVSVPCSIPVGSQNIKARKPAGVPSPATPDIPVEPYASPVASIQWL